MKTRLLINILIMVICILPDAGTLYAQNMAGRIDSLLTTLNKRYELSGNVLVAADGKVVYKHSFGYADLANKVLNSDSSAFILASLAKPFTAVAILQLEEKGKLKLDDVVSKYLPDFPYNTITVRQLLSHTSGLTDLQIFENPYKADTNKIFSNADIIPAIRADRNALIAQPGEKFSYSNAGYGILALMVEKITGISFQDYLRKLVFAPAKMNHTYIRSKLIDQNPGDRNRTKNYDFPSYAPNRLLVADSMKKHKIELINLGGILGPDAVVSTTGDLLRFDQALYGSKLLRESTLREAFTPVKLNNGQNATGGWGKIAWYSGLGWMILRDRTNGKIVFHPGGNTGAVTILLRNLTRHQTVVVLDNVTHRGVHGTGVDILNLLNSRAIISDKQSLAKIYANRLFEKGIDYATSRFNELKNDTAHYFMDERESNNLGYDLLNDGHHADGVAVLRLNTLLYPNSWNAYDSYAEALSLVGKTEEAIAMYQLSIKMNPGNLGEKKMLKKLEGKN